MISLRIWFLLLSPERVATRARMIETRMRRKGCGRMLVYERTCVDERRLFDLSRHHGRHDLAGGGGGATSGRDRAVGPRRDRAAWAAPAARNRRLSPIRAVAQNSRAAGGARRR